MVTSQSKPNGSQKIAQLPMLGILQTIATLNIGPLELQVSKQGIQHVKARGHPMLLKGVSQLLIHQIYL